MKIKVLLFMLLAFGGFAASRVTNFMNATDAAACDRWADSVYNSLSERERIAQLIFPIVDLYDDGSTKTVLKRYVETNRVGGLLFYEGTLRQYAEFANYAQSLAKVPLLMTLDGEWGLSMRVSDAPRFPHNMALGAVQDSKLLYAYGKEVARECQIMGLQVNFAPVADVNSNPDNPIIGFRSFGEDPEKVAKLSTAYALGLEAGGVQAVGKHFPGHGDTATDSHKTETVVNHTAEQMDSVDLLPFRRMTDCGISGMMVGHIVVPSLDPSGRPASLSEKMTTELLRKKLGFEGLIYTDALAMKGATNTGLNVAIESLKAGADVLLGSNTPMEDIDGIEKALNEGKISSEVIADRCKRILRYKYALGLSHRPAEISLDGLEKRVNSAEAQMVNDALARASVTVLRNTDDILPLGNLAKNKIAVVNLGASGHNDFADICKRYTNVEVFSAPDGGISHQTIGRLKDFDTVIVAVYNDNATTRSSFAHLKDLKNMVAVFMVNPYKMNKFRASLKSAKAIVLAYDNIPEMRRAAAMALFGGISVNGKLPVNLPEIAPIGTGVKLKKTRLGYSTPLAEGLRPSLTDSLDRLMTLGVETKAMPGGQLLVARNGNIVYEKAFGHLSMDGKDTVNLATLYDLASVSKATGTLPGIMKAYQLGLFDLDTPAAEYVPGLAKAGKTFTPREMLYHETGMPASLNIFKVMMDSTSFTGPLFSRKRDRDHGIFVQKGSWGNSKARIRRDITSVAATEMFPIEAALGLYVGQATIDTVMDAIYNQELRNTKEYNYSCLNFCLLLDMEQRLTGQPHQQWVTDSIYAPLGAMNITYRPAEKFPLGRIAPTEKDNFLRRQTVHGFVHDETAAMLGGVSGNAGLFANAGDLAKLCQMWLNGGKYGDAQVLDEETVKIFTTSKSPTCRRGLGFDKPDTENPDYSPTCDEAGASVYGHLGFTGTVFWVDPSENLIFIFLNNRVNPTRDTPVFNNLGLRPELFRQVYKAIE